MGVVSSTTHAVPQVTPAQLPLLSPLRSACVLVCCAVPLAGTLLCNLGSIMTHWTGGRWKSTLHRVTNPLPSKAGSSRRLSVALFHKPNYDALIEVVPTCRPTAAAAGGTDQHGGWPGEEGGLGLYPPTLAADLTRQGILYKYRHLAPQEASAAYHKELAHRRGG
jgi:hypothetical protein